MDKKYLSLLKNLNKIKETSQILEIQEALKEDINFIKQLKNCKSFTHKEHDGLLKLLLLEKNTNGYFMDKYGNRISYNGIRTLKRSKTELKDNIFHDIENYKCKNDYKYFRAHYCFITTKTGLARPEPRDYQESLEDELLSLEDLVILYPRQSGKTVTAATYLLWLSLYHPTQINIGIVANKPKTAREVLDKIKKIFSALPIWMMAGIEVWNKSEIEYENMTRIMTDSPSSDSFRGYTCNIIYTDEAAYIKKSLWDEFIDAVMPTMNSLIFKQVISTSTANGMNHFQLMCKGATNQNKKIKSYDCNAEAEILVGHDGVFTPEKLFTEFQRVKAARARALEGKMDA